MITKRAVLFTTFLLGAAHLIIGQASVEHMIGADTKSPSPRVDVNTDLVKSGLSTTKDEPASTVAEAEAPSPVTKDGSDKDSKEGYEPGPAHKLLEVFSKILGSFQSNLADTPEDSDRRTVIKEAQNILDNSAKIVDSLAATEGAIDKGSTTSADEDEASTSQGQSSSYEGDIFDLMSEIFDSLDPMSSESEDMSTRDAQQESKEEDAKKAPARKLLKLFSAVLGSLESTLADEPEDSFARRVHKESRKVLRYASRVLDSALVDCLRK